MSTGKGRRRAWTKGAVGNFSNERRKNISSDFYLYVLVLVTTDNANTTIKILKLFLQIFFLLIPACLFLMFLCFYFVDFVFHRYFARAMVERSILQLYRTNIFLAQRQMTVKIISLMMRSRN